MTLQPNLSPDPEAHLDNSPASRARRTINYCRDIAARWLVALSWAVLGISFFGPACYGTSTHDTFNFFPILPVLMLAIGVVLSVALAPLMALITVPPLLAFIMTPFAVAKRGSLLNWITRLVSFLLLAPWLALRYQQYPTVPLAAATQPQDVFIILWGGYAIIAAFTMNFVAVWLQPASRWLVRSDRPEPAPRDLEYERRLNLREETEPMRRLDGAS